MIKLYIEDKVVEDCTSVIIVPEKAVEEPGYIKTLTAKNDVSSKHEFHAMTQMAYFQFQDDELEVTEPNGEIRVESGETSEILQSGMVLYRDTNNAFFVLIHEGLNRKKILEAAYRFCTRWVRLDI